MLPDTYIEPEEDKTVNAATFRSRPSSETSEGQD